MTTISPLRLSLLYFGIIAFTTITTIHSFTVQSPSSSTSTKTFHFGGGCFWAPADNLRNIDGILSTSVGYCGDDTPFTKPPSYDKVCAGRTNLVEAVRVEYDDTILSYNDMLSLFAQVNTAEWANKRQYKGIIFTSNKEEETKAKQFLQQNTNVVAVTESMSQTFYTAEKYHQNYWAKWRVRIPSLIGILVLFSNYGDLVFSEDVCQKVYNGIIWVSVVFAMSERRFFTDQKKIIVE